MNEILVSEIFGAIQGEGPNTGKPSIFIRLAGCNLACHWCDAWYTWNWEGTDFKHLTQPKVDPKVEIHKYTEEAFRKAFLDIYKEGRYNHVVLTGGEPLIQQKNEILLELLDMLSIELTPVEVETNGTIRPTEEFDALIDYYDVSPKLENSNNVKKLRERPRVYEFFAGNPKAVFKYVICDEKDLKEVRQLAKDYNIKCDQIYLMPEGVTQEEIQPKLQWLSEICKKEGYRLTSRLQVTTYGNRRGV